MLHGFEVQADGSSIAHAFRQALGVRQDSNGAQGLRIALQQNALAGVGAKSSSDHFLPQAQLDEIQIRVELRNLQTLTEISSEKNSTVIFPAQFMSTVEDVKNFLAKEKA